MARDPAASAARDELCQLYWTPLYAFARRTGLSAEDAEDATQEFFVQFAAGERLRLVDVAPAGGRLRTYFLKIFQRLLIDEHRHRHRMKRGGGILHVGLEEAESWLADDSITDPLAAYDRCWALALLDSAMTVMARDYATADRALQFDLLRPFLGMDQSPEPAYETIAATLALSPVSARQTVHRFRDRFRAILRRHVAATLDDPDESAIDMELRALTDALR